MPCYSPLLASYVVAEDGKKKLKFSNALARTFKVAGDVPHEGNLKIPCGQCKGCRLERSRQWAVRCMHEAKLPFAFCRADWLQLSQRYQRKGSTSHSLYRSAAGIFPSSIFRVLQNPPAKGYDYCQPTQTGSVVSVVRLSEQFG